MNRWEVDAADFATCIARSSSGNANANLKRGTETISLCGRIEDLKEILTLVSEAQTAREHARAQISGDGIGYFILFVHPTLGLKSMHFHTYQPITTWERLMEIQEALSQKLGAPVQITDWRELEKASRIIASTGGPLPGAANFQ